MRAGNDQQIDHLAIHRKDARPLTLCLGSRFNHPIGLGDFPLARGKDAVQAAFAAFVIWQQAGGRRSAFGLVPIAVA